MESLQPELAPFGIHTTIVEPASFRTEILTRKSAIYAESALQAVLAIAGQESPPPRFIAGPDAIAMAEQKVAALQEAIHAYRDLSVRWPSTRSTPPGTGPRSSCANGFRRPRSAARWS